MSSKGKYIGVESRVQYEVLEAAIYDYLSNGKLDKEKCLSHIKQFTKGENRAGKILKHISVLLAKNEGIISKFSKQLDAGAFAQLSSGERKALVLCLFCNSFPITYDILIGFAQAFKVQSIVSKEVIIHKIGSAYGSNRAMHIAVTEILPFLIECGTIERVKVGIYSTGSKLSISNKVISELIVFTDIKLSASKSMLINELGYKPWYSYFELSNITPTSFNILLAKKDSAVGKGYLTMKG
ncbi:MAG: hypothetical protein IPJ86_10655 [Bacteroidetes bacterium]|nr:hypothetical protein [Bacteroidota bacterium]